MKKDIYNTIQKPLLTEKVTNLMNQNNQYAFKVSKDASKKQIKKAVEKLFSVNVTDVTVVINKGKVKRSRYGLRRKSDWKKAYISLAEGQSIDMGTE